MTRTVKGLYTVLLPNEILIVKEKLVLVEETDDDDYNDPELIILYHNQKMEVI